MSANNGSFPGAGQGNWWERANYGGQGQAPATPAAPSGMVTGYPGSTQWFASQQANYPSTAPGGTDWLRNMQQLQQWYQQQQGPGPGIYGGGLGYGQQGGLAAPQAQGADPLRQQQGGLSGTGGGQGYLSAAPQAQPGAVAPPGMANMWQQAYAPGTTPGSMATAPAGTPTGLPYNAVPGDTALRYADALTNAATPSQPTLGNLGNGALMQGGAGPQGTLPGGDPRATPAPTPPATNTDQTVGIAMQNGRPPTTQTTTAAQLATTQGATTMPTVTDTGSAAGSQATIGGGPNGAGPVRDINDALVKAYYTNKNPGAFWQQAGQILSGGDRNFEQFFVGNFDRYMAQYLQAAESNQNLQLSDWLTGPMGAQIRRDYLMQAPEQRGLDYRRTDPGRFDMRY